MKKYSFFFLKNLIQKKMLTWLKNSGFHKHDPHIGLPTLPLSRITSIDYEDSIFFEVYFVS